MRQKSVTGLTELKKLLVSSQLSSLTRSNKNSINPFFSLFKAPLWSSFTLQYFQRGPSGLLIIIMPFFKPRFFHLLQIYDSLNNNELIDPLQSKLGFYHIHVAFCHDLKIIKDEHCVGADEN